MTHEYPSVLPSALTVPRAEKFTPSAPTVRPATFASAVHYPLAPRSRTRVLVAVLVSAAAHAGVLLGVRSHPAPPPVEAEHSIAISIALPVVQELEEPEKVRDDSAEKVDPAEYAPTLADVPTISLPTDFVQELNFASLLPRPDLTEAKVFVIPHNILRTGKLGEGLGNIFNLADLDRVPEPVVQQSPVFPPALKHETSYARVVVEFIVDTEGRVLQPTVVDCSFPGFEDAAAFGVSRWRFRPGMRAGRRVNTRMSVPIIFRLKDDSD